MADIKRRFFLRHLQSAPTAYVHHLRKGSIAHQGAGASFWYRPLHSAISEVPIDERELPLLFHARTSDYQDVAVQATVTYRVTDPDLAVERIDFSVHVDTGQWRAMPLEQLGGLLTELAQQYAIGTLAQTTLTDVLVDGLPRLRTTMSAGLRGDERLSQTGIEVVGVRVVAVRPESEVENALQTPLRELLQHDADKATFERRAAAVEHERAIGQNELETQIELARREEELVTQNGQNERLRVTEKATANQITVDAVAAQTVVSARAKAESTELVGKAEADTEAQRLAAYREVSEATLLGLAVRELAANLPQIQNLTITPDLLAPLLSKLAAPIEAEVVAETGTDQ